MSRAQSNGVIASPSSTSSSSSTSRNFGFFNGTSSLTIAGSTWDMRLSKELTFRTCSPEGGLLHQSAAAGSAGFTLFQLHLLNATLVFQWTVTSRSGSGDVTTQVTSATAGEDLADNEQYTVRLKYYLGTVYLNVTRLGGQVLYSTVVANATYNSDLLTAAIRSSALRVGEGLVGCLYGGPGVDFNAGGVVASNVSWNSCPLQSTPGCTMSEY